MGARCHQGVIRTCSEKIQNSSGLRDEKLRSCGNGKRPAMIKSSTVASSAPSQVKTISRPISSAAPVSHQNKQLANCQQSKPNQNQLRRKLSRKLELMPQLDWRAFPGSGVTKDSSCTYYYTLKCMIQLLPWWRYLQKATC